MKNFILLLIILFTSTSTIYSQKEISIQDIEMLNLGDGQQFAHKRGDKESPINGKIRLITGITTQYIDAEFKDGYSTGKWEYYNNNNLTEYTTFENGYINGAYAKCNASGDIIVKGNFAKGKKDGTWEEFNSDGDKKQTEIYAADKVTKRITYYTNGNVDSERNFKDGKENGVTKKYTMEGKIKTEQNYVIGKQVGKQIVHFTSNNGNYIETSNYNEKGKKDGEFSEIFSDNKAVKSKGKYLNGQKDGKWMYGYHNGKLYKEENYKNGSLIDSKKL